MSAFRQGVMVVVFAVVVLLIARLAIVPDPRFARVDRYRSEVEGTCHSMDRFFVGGVKRISALFGVEVDTDKDDWPDVVRLMEDLAGQLGMSFVDASFSQPGVETLQLSICASGQPLILVNEIEWDFGSAEDLRRRPRREPSVNFAMYGDVPESIWQPVATDLFVMLRARWPSRVKFRDGDGRLTYGPAFLYSDR